ncbi:MAG: DUF3618 domain-containing protein, partial [Shimia sp.]
MSDRDPRDIEREIERERSELASSLEQLSGQFSPERIVNSVTAAVSENGGEFSRQLGRAVRDNPIGLAVTGIGLALLFTGNSKKKATYDRAYAYDARDSYTPRDAHVSYDPRTGTTAAGFREDYDPADFDRRLAAASGDESSTWDDAKDRAAGAWNDAKAQVNAWGDKASRFGSEAEAKVDGWKADAERTGGAWRDSAQSKGAEWKAKARAQQARFRASASEMQRDVESGLNQFSEDAKQRIRNARQMAIDARYEAEQRARYYG